MEEEIVRLTTAPTEFSSSRCSQHREFHLPRLHLGFIFSCPFVHSIPYIVFPHLRSTFLIFFSIVSNGFLNLSFLIYLSIHTSLHCRCPFITAVGGTTSINPEVGVSFSGGGFSRYFARPDYQTGAVSEFLGNLGVQYGDLYKLSPFAPLATYCDY